MGINTAFVSAELAAHAEFRQELNVSRISTFLIFPVFQNPEYLAENPDSRAITHRGSPATEDWVEFVCPSRGDYRRLCRERLIEQLSRLQPDGLSLDFIRQFVYWEMIHPEREPGSLDLACFCPHCIGEFKSETGLYLPDTCTGAEVYAAFMISEYPAELQAFRCRQITSMISNLAEAARTVCPGIRLAIHTVPWRDVDFGNAGMRVAAQDIKSIAPLIDYISPMCYSHMLKRDAAWIESVTQYMDNLAPGKVLPSIQVYPYYIDDPFTAADFAGCTEAALRPPGKGVVFFSWPLFERDTLRIVEVERILRNRLRK